MVKWAGKLPNCDFCNKLPEDYFYFIDGKTKYGPWAIMCPDCFIEFGVGLGTGLGQKYDTSTLEKVEG